MRITNQASDILITYSLGSCVGVTIYDPMACVGGMIHCMLPLSKIDPEKAKKSPAMFVDTGVPMLFEAAYRMGAAKSRIILKVAGASCILDEKGTFKIGERNYAVLRKMLWKNNVLIAAEDVGGALPRTMDLEIATGRVTIKSRGNIMEL
ncbi:chemotaxis protein CheD [Candidatus Poribacteria bacterium]